MIRSSGQRLFAAVMMVMVLAYAIMTPAAMASMWSLDHGEHQVLSGEDPPCHGTEGGTESPGDSGTTLPCCEGGQCLCFIVPPGIAASPWRQAGVPHDAVTMFIDALHPRSLRESPLRPPNA